MVVRPVLLESTKLPLHLRHMELDCNWRDRDSAREIKHPLSILCVNEYPQSSLLSLIRS